MKQSEFLYNLGRRIERIRKSKKLSQIDVSNETGFTNNTISALENGKSDSKILTYDIYAKFLNVSLAQLISDAETTPYVKSKKLEELVELLREEDDQVIERVIEQSKILLSAIKNK